jgi:hypothetical protein
MIKILTNIGQDPDVLNLLKSMWLHNLRKLKMAAREDGEESSPDEEEVVVVAQAPVPSSSGSQSWVNQLLQSLQLHCKVNLNFGTKICAKVK